MQNAMMALPPQELQWMQANGGDMNSMCPGLAAMQTNPTEFCSMGAVASDLLPGQFAIMTAQQYQPEKSAPVVPAVIALATTAAGCDSDAACEAQVTCSFDLGQAPQAMHCDVPNVRQACCDIFSIGMTCQSEGQSCMQNAMMALPPQELQWMQANGGDMNSMCPGLAAMQTNPTEFCSMGAVASDLLPGQFAIMTAQQYQPEKPGPVVPGVIGVAIGAAVVTSFVAMRKKVNSADLYNLLADDVA